MKKLITIVLFCAPMILMCQEWDNMVFSDTSDSLSIREDARGTISLLMDESFIRNIPCPVVFKSLKSEKGVEDLLRIVNRDEVKIGGQIYIDLEPVIDIEKGECYRFNMFSEKSQASLFISYYPKRAKVDYFELPFESVEEIEEVVIFDHRTIKPEAEIAIVDTVKMDTIHFEYEQGDFEKLPRFVYSISESGKHYRSVVNRLSTGLRVREDGEMVVEMPMRIVPYKVEPGRKTYRVIIKMGDGRELRKRIVILRDVIGSS